MPLFDGNIAIMDAMPIEDVTQFRVQALRGVVAGMQANANADFGAASALATHGGGGFAALDQVGGNPSFAVGRQDVEILDFGNAMSVSYTHLTLPTKRIV